MAAVLAAAGHCEGTADAAVKRSPSIDTCLNGGYHTPTEHEGSPATDRDQAAEEELKPPAAHTQNGRGLMQPWLDQFTSILGDGNGRGSSGHRNELDAAAAEG
jgi:hypothetical protein